MCVLHFTDVRNVVQYIWLLLSLILVNADEDSFHGPRIDKWHKWHWLPDPLKIGRFNPLKNAEVTFHNQTLLNIGPPDNMPQYYTYGYRVFEPKDGEFKDHREFRNGGLIHGSLRVVENTGAKTNITYEGLPWSGWQALIETQDSSGEEARVDEGQTISSQMPQLTIKLDFTDHPEPSSESPEGTSFKQTTEGPFRQSTTDGSYTKQTLVESPSKQTTEEYSTKQTTAVFPKKTISENPSKPTISVEFFSNPEKSPKETKISSPTKRTTTTASSKTTLATLAPKMARIGGSHTSRPWFQMYRICPSPEPSFRKAHHYGQAGRIRQNFRYLPASNPLKSLQQNPLFRSTQSVFTVPRVFPMFIQPLGDSTHCPVHLQPSDFSMKSTSAAQRYTIHHEEARSFHIPYRRKRHIGATAAQRRSIHLQHRTVCYPHRKKRQFEAEAAQRQSLHRHWVQSFHSPEHRKREEHGKHGIGSHTDAVVK